MDKELVSVIIPVYNVEKYLRKCVDSVLSQTYKNLEIFLVDDGSPDNCGKICDEYAKKDKRIKVIHQQNCGLSSARNAALDVCTGEYITFIDSDDWVEPTYVEELYNAIKKYNCDVSVCGHNHINNDEKVTQKICYESFDEIYRDDICNLFFRLKPISITAWGKLYRRDIFKELRYPVGINYEDTYIITDICANVKKGIAIVKKTLYNYLVLRTGAITQVVSKKKFDSIYASRKNVEATCKNIEMNRIAASRLFYTYNDLYYALRQTKNFTLMDELLKLFEEDYKKYRRVLPEKTRIRFFVFKHCKWLYRKLWSKK